MRFRPATSTRVPSSSFFAELYLTPGPREIGVTGDNSYATLYGSEWLFLIEETTRILRAYQRLDGEWVERTDDARMPPIVGQAMPESVRRLSGTFDQSARAVIAYEVGEGVVTGTRWDPTLNEYKQNIDFSGTDPCVVIDAAWSQDIPNSDVLVFYLSPDRRRVRCRVQRDLYAVEHELWAFDAPVILDRVVAAPIRYQALLSDAEGVPLPDALVSNPYPYPAFDAIQANAEGPTAGDYALVVLSGELAEELTATATGPASGAYADPVINHELTGEGIDAAATGPTGGDYVSVIINYGLSGEGIDAEASGPTGGDYVLVVLETSLSGEGINATATSPAGGSYDPA